MFNALSSILDSNLFKSCSGGGRGEGGGGTIGDEFLLFLHRENLFKTS